MIIIRNGKVSIERDCTINDIDWFCGDRKEEESEEEESEEEESEEEESEEEEAKEGWTCECGCFNEWTDYGDMNECILEADLKCINCEKHRQPCFDRGAKGLGHPYFDMPFKVCEGYSECCLKDIDIRKDKFHYDEEDEVLYCIECAKDMKILLYTLDFINT